MDELIIVHNVAAVPPDADEPYGEPAHSIVYRFEFDANDVADTISGAIEHLRVHAAAGGQMANTLENKG